MPFSLNLTMRAGILRAPPFPPLDNADNANLLAAFCCATTAPSPARIVPSIYINCQSRGHRRSTFAASTIFAAMLFFPIAHARVRGEK